MENVRSASTSLRRSLQWLIVVAMLAVACSSTITIDDAEIASGGSDAESSTAPTETVDELEPTPEPTEAPTPTAAPESTEAPADDEADGNDTDSDDPGAEPEDADDSDLDDAVSDITPGTAEVRLIDAGAEPRQELRLQIAPSCGEVLTMFQVQDLVQTINGQAQPAAGPIGNVMTMSTSATRIGDNYEIRSEVLSAEAAPGTPADLTDFLNNELEKVVGLTSFATMDNRGIQVPGSSRVEGAEALGALASTVESVNQLQSPLPVEAVGVGAQWETISVLDLDGLIVTNIAETTLISVEGTVVELASVGRQVVADNAVMQVPGTSATAEVIQWDSATEAVVTIDLATISPITSNATTQATQQLDFGAGPTGGVLDQEILSEIELSSAPDDGCTGRSVSP